jgi:hypothetical protein
MEFELVEKMVYSGYRILKELNHVESNHKEYFQQNIHSNLLFSDVLKLLKHLSDHILMIVENLLIRYD